MDSTFFIFLVGTCIFVAIFIMGLHNLVDGVWHKCWHKWGKWGKPMNTGKHVIQMRICTKCNEEGVRFVLENATVTYEDDTNASDNKAS